MPQELSVLFIVQGIYRMIEFSAPILTTLGLLLLRDNVWKQIIVGMLLGIAIPDLFGRAFSLSVAFP